MNVSSNTLNCYTAENQEERLFFNETALLFWCYALWKLGSLNCCIFEKKHATGMETCAEIYFFIVNQVYIRIRKTSLFSVNFIIWWRHYENHLHDLNICSSSNINLKIVSYLLGVRRGTRGRKMLSFLLILFYFIFFYYYKGCESSVNQSFGWLNFTKSDYSTLNCSIQINNAGVTHGFALISFQYINLGYCR